MLYPKNEFYADSSSQCEVNRQAAARSRVGHLLVESVDGGRLLAVVPDKLDAGDDDGEQQSSQVHSSLLARGAPSKASQTNSTPATMTASARPTKRTTKMPPTLATPSELALPEEPRARNEH